MAAKLPTALDEDLRPRWPTLWDAVSIRDAERRAESGYLSEAADLCKEMMADDRVRRSLTVRARGILALPFAWEEGAGGKRAALNAKRKLEIDEDWYAMAPASAVGDLQEWGILLGVGFAQKVWGPAPASQRHVPKLDTWNPRSFRYDTTRRMWVVRTADLSEVDVTSDRFVMHAPFGRKTPGVRGVWRAVARWWLLKQYAQADFMKLGQSARGQTVVTPPPPMAPGQATAGQTEDIEAARRRRVALAREINSMVEQRLIVLPTGYDIKLVQQSATTHEVYVSQIELANAGIAQAICGQNLSSEVSGNGSYAAATVHREVELTMIRGDASALADTLHDQLLVDWADQNLREGAAAAPWPLWDTKPPKDQAQFADTLTKNAEAITKWNVLLAPRGEEVDVIEVAQQLSIPRNKLKEAVETRGEMFAYHLQYGVVTLDEARKYIGLPPLPNGQGAARTGQQDSTSTSSTETKP